MRIYAERGSGPQPAEMAPRVGPGAPPPLISIDLLFPVCAVFPVVPPDVASVARLHFGALSPARRAPEVRLAIFFATSNSLRPCLFGTAVLPDVASVVRLHFGALSPARRALEVRLALFLLHQTHSDLACLELVCFPT